MPHSAPTRVLLAAHSPGLTDTLLNVFAGRGLALSTYEAATAGKLAASLAARVTQESPDLVILELQSDLEPLARLRAYHPETHVVVLLNSNHAEIAFQASKLGAEDLISISATNEEMQQQITRLLARLQSQRAVAAAAQTSPEEVPPALASSPTRNPDGTPALFGTHPRMAEIRDTIAKVATTSATVLIRGESGVGKEIVARMIYARSPRSEKPFIKVNCAAIPNELLESELFGYEAGAFTGAVKSKPGKFELAHTGTLFLDEIGEMHPQLQAKLLHVLQDGEFSRLGAKQDVRVDVRLVCATNKLLEQRVAEGLFREDLFYRINVVTMHIPPLRERRDEIQPLIRFFLDKYATLYDRPRAPFSAEAEVAMLSHTWPGNIRELENLCKRFVIVGGETQILREMAAHSNPTPPRTPLPEVARPAKAEVSPMTGNTGAGPERSLYEIGKEASSRAEAIVIRRTLEQTRWNRKEAARRLQMSYKSLLNRLKELELKIEGEQI